MRWLAAHSGPVAGARRGGACRCCRPARGRRRQGAVRARLGAGAGVDPQHGRARAAVQRTQLHRLPSRAAAGRRPRSKGPACRVSSCCACRPGRPTGTSCRPTPCPARRAEGAPLVRYTDVPVTLADGTAVVLRRPTFAIGDAALRAGAGASVAAAGAVAARPRPAGGGPRRGDRRQGRSGRPRRRRHSRPRRRRTVRSARRAAEPARPGRGRAAARSGPADHAARRRPPATARRARRPAAPRRTATTLASRGSKLGDEILDSIVAYLAALPPPAAPASGHDAARRRSVRRARLRGLPRADARRRRPPRPTPTSCCTISAPSWPTRVPRADPAARLWRTAPLWGLGTTPALLHDGRARDAQEAILWHGGEAAAARERFRALDAGGARPAAVVPGRPVGDPACCARPC